MKPGYYRYPTIHQDSIVFISEDDLWSVPAIGGTARRITATPGRITYPRFSPDGQWLSFLSRDEGMEEIYVMPAAGGSARRLTYIGGRLSRNAGWTPDGRIVFSSHLGKPILRYQELAAIAPEGGWPQPLPYGPARAIAFGPDGGVVIGRHTDDPRHWKRDRGGMAGTLWIARSGNGEFRKLIELDGDLGSPLWLGDRIYFLSDHEGMGNLYSCTPDGDGLARHTWHETYYACNADSDGKRIVYHSGADLYLFEPDSGEHRQIPVVYPSGTEQLNRKFVDAEAYLDSWNLHPDGRQTAITTRGKAFTFPHWEGPVTAYTQQLGARCRLLHWLHDGKRLVALTDSEGEEQFIVFHSDGLQPPQRLPYMDIGRVMHIGVNPRKDQIAFSNQRREIYFLDLSTQELVHIDTGDSKRLMKDLWNGLRTLNTITFDWSPDGEWLAYSLACSKHGSQIRLWHAAERQTYPLTPESLYDEAPAFDPSGRYLYFISYRFFDPVADTLHFEYSFPYGMRPCLVTLQKDTPSPFAPGQTIAPPAEMPLRIDLEGIQDRILSFPVQDGIYLRVAGVEDKVLFTRFLVFGLKQVWSGAAPALPTASLECFDLAAKEQRTLLSGVHDFKVARQSNALLLRANKKLRVVNIDQPPDTSAGEQPGKSSGWIDLKRVRVAVEPAAEWRQMFREAWRLQRDLYWVENMSNVDWQAVYDRYLPLVNRVNSRSELSALIWEMQSELAIGHAYEDGGDYRPHPDYALGHLAADFVYDQNLEGWKLAHIVRGDTWDPQHNSPLNAPGLGIQEGDLLVAVNGQQLDAHTPPAAALVNQSGMAVSLAFRRQRDGREDQHTITVQTLQDEMPARYREWVLANRRQVHQATGGRVGYIHMPDMEVDGFNEFHRGFLEEIEREGLVVDVRYNTGGMVSPLLLEKLERRKRHIGFNRTRWTKTPEPYPYETMTGPMVALANELTGSDGDLFANGFKMWGLGPLVGKRTWGGVIGIAPRNPLVDGTQTTQPENAFWFFGPGWGIENHGVEPDIEVENLPQDYARGVDRQLETAITEILRLLESDPPRQPEFEQPPGRNRK